MGQFLYKMGSSLLEDREKVLPWLGCRYIQTLQLSTGLKPGSFCTKIMGNLIIHPRLVYYVQEFQSYLGCCSRRLI